MTACAPNFLALEFIRKIVHVEITYRQWMTRVRAVRDSASAGAAAACLLDLSAEIKRSPAVPEWAAGELEKMGGMSAHEIILTVLVLIAIALWVGGGDYVDAATAAFIVVSLMLVTGIITWNDMAKNDSAWTTIALLATAGHHGRRLGALGVHQMVRRCSSPATSAACRRR